jgi:hypothetical protein
MDLKNAPCKRRIELGFAKEIGTNQTVITHGLSRFSPYFVVVSLLFMAEVNGVTSISVIFHRAPSCSISEGMCES